MQCTCFKILSHHQGKIRLSILILFLLYQVSSCVQGAHIVRNYSCVANDKAIAIASSSEALIQAWKDIRGRLKSALIILEGGVFNPCETCDIRESVADVIYFHGIILLL